MTTPDVNWFTDRLLSLQPEGDPESPEYTARLSPVLAMYPELTTYQQRWAFLDALELMLRDPREQVRKYAVAICLAFFDQRATVRPSAT